MPRTRTIQNNFTTGVIDPKLHERHDYDGYNSGCATLENMVVFPQGGVTRRPGTRYVATAKNSTVRRLMPFVFSGSQANVLEVGTQYIRFFASSGQITSGGSPVEVTTPYTADHVPSLYTAQSGDILFIDQADNAPRELVRLSATSWQLRTSRLIPPPSYEAGVTVNMAVTLSAASGNAITVTAGANLFFPSSVGRVMHEQLTLGSGQLTITSYTSATIVTAAVIDTFSKTSYTDGELVIDGSPQATLRVSADQPVGKEVTLNLLGINASATNLITNGTFANLASWTDHSGPEVTSGASDAAGGAGDEVMFDAAATFITDNVKVGHRLLDETNVREDRITGVNGETVLSTSAGGATWNAVNNYLIKQTGAAAASGGRALLDGGSQGYAAISQGITTVVDSYYRLIFDVSLASLSCMVGTAAQAQQITAEATYSIGNQREIIFKATAATTYITFKNNQNTVAGLTNVECRLYDLPGWYGVETGKYVRVNDGIIEVTQSGASSTLIRGVIRKTLSDTDDALPGAWSLEDSRWSATRGWPHCLTFQGDRLIHAATDSDPQRFWGSVPGQPRNFATGVNDNDAVEFQPAATEINQILWLFGERALIAGTQREEFTIRGELGHTLTATGIDASSPSKVGSAPIQPVRTPQSLLFVSRGARRLYENTGIEDFSGDDRQVEDRSILTEHLTSVGIRSIAFQQEPDPVVWVVTEDNVLHSMTVLPNHKVFAWATHPMDDDVLDVCVIPHADGDRDQVWLLIDRGGSAPYIEYLDDESGHYGKLMVDSGLTATYSPATTTVSGLSHLNGREVTVLGDGSVQASKTVVLGQITLDTAAEVVEVGLGFTPTVTTLRPVVAGGTGGGSTSLTGLQLSNVRVTVSLLNTLGCTINGEFVDFSEVVQDFDTVPDLFTGLKEIAGGGWDTTAAITVSQTQPYPITIRAITRTLEIEEP